MRRTVTPLLNGATSEHACGATDVTDVGGDADAPSGVFPKPENTRLFGLTPSNQELARVLQREFVRRQRRTNCESAPEEEETHDCFLSKTGTHMTHRRKSKTYLQILISLGMIVGTRASLAQAGAAPALAAEKARIRVCVPQLREQPDRDQPLGATLLKDCESRQFVDLEDSDHQPHVHDLDLVLLYVNDSTTKLGAAGITKITYVIRSPGKPPTANEVECPLPHPDTYDNANVLPCYIHSGPFGTSQYDTVEVRANTTQGVITRYARFSQPVSLASTAAGFWFPVGVFGTNFHANSNGITLAALPIGIAWGVQWNIKSKDYLGLSGFASWSVAPQKSDSGVANGDYSLSGVTPGAIIDFDGYAYAGWGYAADFRTGSDHRDPGHMFVAAFGPKLLQLIKLQAQ